MSSNYVKYTISTTTAAATITTTIATTTVAVGLWLAMSINLYWLFFYFTVYTLLLKRSYERIVLSLVLNTKFELRVYYNHISCINWNVRFRRTVACSYYF